MDQPGFFDVSDRLRELSAKGDNLELIAAHRGVPERIRVDNGPGFVSKTLDRWAYERGVTLDFSRPGKPTDNAFVESYKGRLRDKCLDTH